ncbi:hypothetical protein ACSW94_15240 (plasmid) [Clostridium perfringens]|uniref:hypothetical protein n=1 Tax=Clostridium perfringens TaxID=1502 RepID=UPI000D712633|nr:hypothetical protein [Clostridium perfringens]MDK0785661.1 hypothetical protein [Clostridium perfringens]MDK0847265.1 hypothetical protein [Clostridium perfringens]MDM0645457.1 hypothetical protein [Clostridium perfringens]MDM0648475.1 hypothetical protein [Clostridium perfringens]PWW83630.1 hypothetical protein CYK81_15065 [Clostridium perfringens]
MKIFKKIYLILIIILTLIAIGILLYPSISNYINNKYAVNTISEYKNSIKNTSEDRLNELVEKSRIYNIDIAKGITPKDKCERVFEKDNDFSVPDNLVNNTGCININFIFIGIMLILLFILVIILKIKNKNSKIKN